MSSTNRSSQRPSSRHPSAAQRRLIAKREAAAAAARASAMRRRRLIQVLVPLAVVVIVVVVFVVVKLASGAGGPTSGQVATAARSGVIAEVTGVPPATLNAVGTGTVKAMPKAITAPPLTANGKARVLWAGDLWCPYCATERWALTVALSRFGTFSGLGQTASSPTDVYPSTPTLDFQGASYTSKTISFTGVEMQSNQVVNGHYATLEQLTPADQKVFDTYDAPPYVAGTSAGAIPFVDIGGRYVISGASYDPQLLQGKTHQQIASALAKPDSPIAKGVDGTANVITAAICATTGNAPAVVCRSAGVAAAATALARAG